MTSTSQSLPSRNVADWRRTKRLDLLTRRKALEPAERKRIAAIIERRIEERFRNFAHATIGMYWPIRAELDLRDLAARLISHGATIAMPVVVVRSGPLEFWAWTPESAMERGFWNIPVPVERNVVRPDLLIVPVVGFDAGCYRLGYGGGYYDRTLAELSPVPVTVGVGLQSSLLDTIHPQPHDIPLDFVITEHRVYARPGRRGTDPGDEDPNDRPTFSSPPCLMHEAGGMGLGPLSSGQTVRLLNELLEAERAGARGTVAIRDAFDGAPQAALRDIALDEGRFCSMLARHIGRLGGHPSHRTGDFYEKLIATPGPEQIALLNRGQRWVVRKLAENIPLIDDGKLRADLEDMLAVHERNIARCSALD